MVIPPAEFQTHYPSFITTRPGPQEKDMTVLDSITKSIRQILASQWTVSLPGSGLSSNGGVWERGILVIQDAIVNETVRYFGGELNYRFILLPVTTGAISSPMGLDSDSLPVHIDLFDEKTYLADSMHFI